MNKQNDQTIRPQPNNKTEQKSTKKNEGPNVQL